MAEEINIAASLTKTQAQQIPIIQEQPQRQTWNSRKSTPQKPQMNQYGF